MNIHILEGNFERAKEIGSKIVSLAGRIGQSNDESDSNNESYNSFGSIEQSWTKNSNSSDQNDNEILNEQLNIR